ncbi:hypothetical protein [Methylocystis bryophila]|uniref:Uncharacterized protein n=1 Tax=Methylocystis bryophila TaxID=655015 RepID=A0A1W6MUU9_9HYPH|nr:hypothetical protein [Methylocystis bryophila]ARN81388.1 hypothetical protein B1812_10200 [Methylocystis bryophila]BDV37377.1 hypothetical protein DSM21852_06300 [Methylocystis bryophila]
MRRVFGGVARARGASLCFYAVGLALFLSGRPALAQQSPHPAPAALPFSLPFPPFAAPPVARNDAATPHPPPSGSATAGGNLSKFEARRVRHACQERANEKALKGQAREDFLLGCVFGRSATRRAVRRECRKRGLAKGLDKAALHDFMHQCTEALYAGQKPAE